MIHLARAQAAKNASNVAKAASVELDAPVCVTMDPQQAQATPHISTSIVFYIHEAAVDVQLGVVHFW